MSSGQAFETVRELTFMKQHLVEPTLVELRHGSKPNSRQRIEKIKADHPNTSCVTSVGGNSAIFVRERGRIKARQMFDVGAHYLRSSDRDLPDIAIYPFGIEDVKADGLPIFQDPDSTTMKSIALVYPSTDRAMHWLQRPIEPLFNVDEDGIVFARTGDLPTPSELQLLDVILDEFESAATPPSH